MPIYTYQCENCGVRFEKHQKFADPPLIRCPECSKNTLRKVYTPVGIVFKGSGFYATDNRSASGMNRANGSAKSESSEESKPSTPESTDKPKKSEES